MKRIIFILLFASCTAQRKAPEGMNIIICTFPPTMDRFTFPNQSNKVDTLHLSDSVVNLLLATAISTDPYKIAAPWVPVDTVILNSLLRHK